MSNISGQLIKNSYDYVLQSDLITGVVYRIGGSVPVNPKFTSGLTVNASFTYADGSEFPGFVLTCDASGNAVWSPVSGATSGVVVTGGTFNYTTGILQLVNSNGSQVTISGLTDTYVTGGTVSGTSIVFSYNDTNTFQVTGITPYNIFSSYTANTQSLILNSVTGGTYSNGTLNLINNSGTTIPITGFTTGTTDSYVTGFTLNNDTITLSQNRIDLYSAFNISLSGYVNNNTFSSYTASTQPLILNAVTGGTFSGSTLYLINNSGATIPITGFTTGSNFTGGTVSGATNFTNGLTANTISATTYLNLPTDVFVTGGTYSAGTTTFTNNTGGTFNVTGFSTSFTGPYLPLSGGTVFGNTYFTSGLSANTLYVSGLTQTSGITSTGGIIFKQVTINSSYTATTSDYMIDVTGGTFSVVLPSAVGIQGRLLVVKNNGGGAVTVQPVLGQTIDGKPFVILGETNTIQLASNGSEWVAISYNISTVNSSTGVFEFTGLSVVSTTTFRVAPVKGWIVDDTSNPLSPQLYYVYYSGGTHTATYVNTATETWVYLTSGGTISQTNIPLTEQQRRQNIFLGKLGHANLTNIINAFSQPDFVLSPLSQLRDMFVPINLINGGIYPSVNGTNLSFNTSAGYLYGLGINFASSTLSPNTLYVSGTSPCTFQYRTQTGGTASNTTFIDPLNYDVGGVITPVPGTRATNQRIYLVQNGVFRVQYGQQTYNTLAAAVAGLATEQFNTFSNFTNNGILIGVLSVISNTTNLSDTDKAKFFFASKFGETIGSAGGVSTTNLQQAYNNSSNPEILTNSTLGALHIKNGTGNPDNVSSIFDAINSAGVSTAFIRADGLISGSSVSTPGFTANTYGLTALTISATTYYNLPVSAVTNGFGISASTSNGTVTITNTAPDQTVIITGGTNIEITGTYPNFGVNFTGSTSSTGDYLPLSGGTVTGGTIFQSGLTANTISATTYLNLPTDIYVTGGTYSAGTTTFTNNTGGTFNVTGFSTLQYFVTGSTPSGMTLNNGDRWFDTITGDELVWINDGNSSQWIQICCGGGGGNNGGSFTGGTVSGATNFIGGLTANTISATTYLNLPTDVFVTGGTYSAGTATFTNNTGGTFDVTGIVTPFTGGTVTGPTIFTNGLTANTISATTYLNLPVTPVHIKIASMSGRFTSINPNSPNIKYMYIGNTNFGWSYGDYDYNQTVDGFGNIRNIRQVYSNVGIPLPTDILSGDKIKICGMCYGSDGVEPPLNETFYVTVSYFTCRDYVTGIDFNVTTLIPVASYSLGINRSICFSEEITTNTTLPGCTTYLVVGMAVGNDSESSNTYKFSYTLDSTQSTTAAANLFIRNCCDPAYSEVIQNNGVAVGKSFVDGDGNCWSVESETTSDITGVRTLSTEYDNCALCIDSNVCPENFIVQSCCGGGNETFTAALVGINVGDTFVDDFGFCWSVMDTTPAPITNVVTIGTVYSSTTCESLECTDANTCPNLLLLQSCCKDMGIGYTTSDILGITVTLNDVFVDTFGICWQVVSENNIGFPSLNFLSGSTIYGNGGEFCDDCFTANSCEINLFYTVQNCCDETIEVVELPAQYSINLVLGLVHDTGMGCYDILSWSDVGTPTLTGAKVISTYSNGQGAKGCNNCISNFLNNTCIGQKQCCTSYEAQLDGLTITGYLCDGTWVLDQSVPKSTSVCMALVFNLMEGFTTSCCTFLVYNPSPTTSLQFEATDCEGNTSTILVRPLETSIECVNCVSKATGPWEWVACP